MKPVRTGTQPSVQGQVFEISASFLPLYALLQVREISASFAFVRIVAELRCSLGFGTTAVSGNS